MAAADRNAYWTTKFTPRPAVIQVPTDYPRGGVFTPQSVEAKFDVTKVAGLAGGVYNLDLATMLGAFATLVFRRTFEEDMVLATPIGRLRQTVEPTVTFAALVSNFRKTIDEAVAHRDVKCDVDAPAPVSFSMDAADTPLQPNVRTFC
jgi:hypothetical protein